MNLADKIAVHWTGGVGVFALLGGQLLLGLVLIVAAQAAYCAFLARSKRR